jgi:RHS repeat-associated protein
VGSGYHSTPNTGTRMVPPSIPTNHQSVSLLSLEVVEPYPAGDGSVFSGPGTCTYYERGGVGNILDIMTGDHRRQHRTFRYDSMGRVTHAYIPERGRNLDDTGAVGGTQWSQVFSYDERYNLISSNDSRGVVTRYHYDGDPLNRLQRISYDLTGVDPTQQPVHPCPDVVYTYMPTGDLTRVRTETVAGVCRQVNTYERDGLESVTVTMDAHPGCPLTVGYRRDELGRLETTTLPALYGEGNRVRPVLIGEYGPGGSLTRLTLDGADLASRIQFNAVGQLASLQVGPAGPGQLAEDYGHDTTFPWVTSQRVTRDGALLFGVTYDYLDPTRGGTGRTGQLTGRTDMVDDAFSARYHYDARGRLDLYWAGPAGAPLGSQQYSYDEFGNRTKVVAQGNDSYGNQMVRDGQDQYVYDPLTNQAAERCDAAGNLVRGPRSFEYDAAGRPVLVRDGLGAVLSRYIYGACNRRRGSQNGETGDVTYYAWDGDKVIAEYVDRTPAGATDTLQWWTRSYFLGIRLLAQTQYRGLTSPVLTTYMHPDLTGTTRYKSRDDYAGRSVELLPFGSTMGVVGASYGPVFTTYDRDDRASMDYAVNRGYQYEQGRFQQPDPLGPAAFDPARPESLNLYAYCGNDPVNFADPLGLVRCEHRKGYTVCYSDLTGKVVSVQSHNPYESVVIGERERVTSMSSSGRTIGAGVGFAGGAGGRDRADPAIKQAAKADPCTPCFEFLGEFARRFADVNRQIPGSLAPVGFGFRTAKTVAAGIGEVTVGTALRELARGASGMTIKATAGELMLSAGVTSVANFWLVGTAFELGLAAGTLADTAYSYFRGGGSIGSDLYDWWHDQPTEQRCSC